MHLLGVITCLHLVVGSCLAQTDNVSFIIRQHPNDGDIVVNRLSKACPMEGKEVYLWTCVCPENTTVLTNFHGVAARCMSYKEIDSNLTFNVEVSRARFASRPEISFAYLFTWKCNEVEIANNKIHLWDFLPQTMEGLWIPYPSDEATHSLWTTPKGHGEVFQDHYLNIALLEPKTWSGLVIRLDLVCSDDNNRRKVLLRMTGKRQHPFGGNGAPQPFTIVESTRTTNGTTAKSGSKQTTIIISAAVSGAVLLLIIIAIILYCCIKQRRLREMTERSTKRENMLQKSQFTQAARGFSLHAKKEQNVQPSPRPLPPARPEDRDYQSLSSAFGKRSYALPGSSNASQSPNEDTNSYAYMIGSEQGRGRADMGSPGTYRKRYSTMNENPYMVPQYDFDKTKVITNRGAHTLSMDINLDPDGVYASLRESTIRNSTFQSILEGQT